RPPSPVRRKREPQAGAGGQWHTRQHAKGGIVLRKMPTELRHRLLGRQSDCCRILAEKRAPENPSRPARDVTAFETREECRIDFRQSANRFKRQSRAFSSFFEVQAKDFTVRDHWSSA